MKRSVKKVAKVSKTAAKKVTAKKVAAKKAEEVVTGRGRHSAFRGMRLFPSAAVKKANPRHPTAKQRSGKTHAAFGFVSLELIRKSPGLRYEDFIEKGGRPNDLRWDVDRKRVEVRA